MRYLEGVQRSDGSWVPLWFGNQDHPAEENPLYGTARDHRRVLVVQRFYAGVVDYAQRIRALDPTMPRPAPPTLWDDLHHARLALFRWARRSGAVLRLVWAALCVVTIAVRKKQPERGTPFTNRVDDFFRALCDLRGWKVWAIHTA